MARRFVTQTTCALKRLCARTVAHPAHYGFAWRKAASSKATIRSNDVHRSARRHDELIWCAALRDLDRTGARGTCRRSRSIPFARALHRREGPARGSKTRLRVSSRANYIALSQTGFVCGRDGHDEFLRAERMMRSSRIRRFGAPRSISHSLRRPLRCVWHASPSGISPGNRDVREAAASADLKGGDNFGRTRDFGLDTALHPALLSAGGLAA